MNSEPTLTPLMQQYREIKSKHPGSILFFRLGDFYEMFFEDAELGARVLGLTLTSRNNGSAASVPLAGVPVKAAGDYVRKLVETGHRVAICDQVEDPRSAKGIVRREVTEIVTPGVTWAADLLDEARNNFVCVVHHIEQRIVIAAADVSTGEFRLSATDVADAEATLARLSPREILISRSSDSAVVRVLRAGADGVMVTERDAWEFEADGARQEFEAQYGTPVPGGFGSTAGDRMFLGPAAVLIRYLRELQPAGVAHLKQPTVERTDAFIPLDEMTRRNLELVESLRGGPDAARGTLLHTLDATQTAMGARLLRQWLLAPLTQLRQINARLEAVNGLVEATRARGAIRHALGEVGDLDRLVGRIATRRATPRDVGALGRSLARLTAIGGSLAELKPAGCLATLCAEWDCCDDISGVVSVTLVDQPPARIGEDLTIRAGVDVELDSLRETRDGGRDAIARIQAEERARTGIPSLKVGYNKVFGYFIEVTHTHQHLIPSDYTRRQTLSGAERYTTPRLKAFEDQVLSAAELLEARERMLFEAMCGRIALLAGRIQQASGRVADLDVLATLAEVAARDGYCRPEITESFDLDIVEGRHPVVERMMPREKFIPNDVRLNDRERVIVLTGPNMAGKSTILRQVGLIVAMAQMGSFVPATRASIGIVDRIFTRVGASDNLVRGQSTFMVEMSETSSILSSATSRSLVLLDEIGRGTATYDGVSIAWAVTEYLHDAIGCKTVFATHYHELTQLVEERTSIRNYNVQVREAGDSILFLYRMQPGPASRSYGIEVAKLAGLPAVVLSRARQVLQLLEGEHLVPALAGQPSAHAVEEGDQLPLFPEPAYIQSLRGVDTDRLTPLEALTMLADLARQARPG